MSLRRDFTKYLGGAAVGGMVGFYVGIQDLLGIRSTDSAPTPQPEPTPEPDTGEDPEPDSESDPGETQEVLIEDDFESDHDMSIYDMRTNSSNSNDWGTETGTTPDDGTHYGYLVESDSGDRTETIATSTETIRWNQSYSFEFLIRCSKYDPDRGYNSADISWRGGIAHAGDETGESTIRLRMFGTDGSGEYRDAHFGGSGVTESDGTKIEWQESTWYNVQGYVDEQNGTAEAKIWENSSPEPDEYQISANIETGINNSLPYSMLVDGDSVQPIRFEFAHMRWEKS